MPSAKEAIAEYVAALRHVGDDVVDYHFRAENGRVSIGRTVGPDPLDIQWGMTWYTPEELLKAAKMRRLDLQKGDPKGR
jgi:hypothetical protein